MQGRGGSLTFIATNHQCVLMLKVLTPMMGDIIVATDINAAVGVIVLQLCQYAFRYTTKNEEASKCLGVELCLRPSIMFQLTATDLGSYNKRKLQLLPLGGVLSKPSPLSS